MRMQQQIKLLVAALNIVRAIGCICSIPERQKYKIFNMHVNLL